MENIKKVDCADVLYYNYLPYAMSVIISRAIPGIDGLKPVQRRTLYSMYELKLHSGVKAKSSRIVGDTMKYHPNGDAAIYDALVRLTTGYDGILCPYVKSKGNFGKVYSRDMAYAAPRYTEASLTKLGLDLFDGLHENAVNMLDNYDQTLKEPELLPVKFPNILVNSSAGVAVGMSSSIPGYPLVDICKATVGILEGKLTTVEDLLPILQAPDFTTGGIVHNNKSDFLDVLKGEGSVQISSKYAIEGNHVNITEIPYSTTAEAIIDSITNLIKTGVITEISDAIDSSDLNGLCIELDFKRGVNVQQALEKVFHLTPLRSKISFINRVIINAEPRLLSVFELLQEWIKFREETIERQYVYKLETALAKEEVLMTWEIIQTSLKEVVRMLTDMSEADAAQHLKTTFKLTDVQVSTLLESRIKDITEDNVAKKLTALAKLREDIKVFRPLATDIKSRDQLIISELKAIIKQTKEGRRSSIGAAITKTKFVEQEDTSKAFIVITERGLVKKFKTKDSAIKYQDSLGTNDTTQYFLESRNCDDMLIFTIAGICHQIPIKTIEEGKNGTLLVKYLDADDTAIYITASNGYTSAVQFINSKGKGYAIPLSKFKNRRAKYRSVFRANFVKEDGKLWATEEKAFFLLADGLKTKKYGVRKKAAFCDLRMVVSDNLELNHIGAFKVARVGANDTVTDLCPLSQMPGHDKMDLTMYQKGHFVNLVIPETEIADEAPTEPEMENQVTTETEDIDD